MTLPSVPNALHMPRKSTRSIETHLTDEYIAQRASMTKFSQDIKHIEEPEMIKNLSAATLALTGLLSLGTAFAADEHNTVPGLTAAGAPLGLHGVDPVAFIEIGNRVDGSAAYTAVHDGVAYYFASAANKERFERSPARYEPQNGGFCTFGVSVGKKFDGDPQYAAVVDGKLYVFLNEGIFQEFQKDRSGTIRKASANWKQIRTTRATEL